MQLKSSRMKNLSSTWCLKSPSFSRRKHFPQTIKLLRDLGYDVKAVAQTTFKGHENEEIAALAQFENRIIILLMWTLAQSATFQKEDKSSLS